MNRIENNTNNYISFQHENPFNESGLNIKESIKSIGTYKGITSFDFNPFEYSITVDNINFNKKLLTNKGLKLLEKEKVTFNKTVLNNEQYNTKSYNNSSNLSNISENINNNAIDKSNIQSIKYINNKISAANYNYKNKDSNYMSYSNNKNIVEFKKCKQVKSKTVFTLNDATLTSNKSTILNTNIQENVINSHEIYNSNVKDIIKIRNSKNNTQHNNKPVEKNNDLNVSPLVSNFNTINNFNTNKAVIDKELLKELEIDLKEYSTCKTSKLTHVDLEKILDEELLQKYIFDLNYIEIERLILQFSYDKDLVFKLLNTQDSRDIHPLFLCIYLREAKINEKKDRDTLLNIIKLLIHNNIKIRIRNLDKRTPLEEAISYKDKELVRLIYEQALINKKNRIILSKKKASLLLENIPDFYLEMRWEVNVPLFSYMCPNDTVIFWKIGKSIRMDYTFLKLKGLSSVRAPSSFIYDGDIEQSYLINWETKKWIDNFEPLEQDEIDLIINDLLEGTRLNSEFKLKDCKFTPSLNWRGKHIYEKIEGWNAQKYDVKVGSYFDLHHHVRTDYINLNKEDYFNYDKALQKKLNIINSYDEAKSKISKNLKIENELVKKQLENLGKSKDKNHSAHFWVAENYPFKSDYFINTIKSINSSNEVMDKIKEFFNDHEVINVLSRGGFPVKIRIPVNLLIDVTVKFHNYKEIDKQSKEYCNLFNVPSHIEKIPRKVSENIKEDFKKRMKYININL